MSAEDWNVVGYCIFAFLGFIGILFFFDWLMEFIGPGVVVLIIGICLLSVGIYGVSQ